MSDLSVSLLETWTVTLDNQEVTDFNYDKVRALLAYLITESAQPHRRENLIGLLWPDYPERQARQSLSQALYTLRVAIGDHPTTRRQPGSYPDAHAFIEATRQSVTFVRESAYRLDVDDFVAHLDAVPMHAHKSLAGCAACLTHLEQAVYLYRGDFMENLAIDDSAAFEEWALLHRENLRRRMLDTLEALTQAYMEHRNTIKALETARRQLAMDPWREIAHRQVMQILALDGQRNAALAHYETCRETLAQELQVEPEDATTALYDSIRDGLFQTVNAPLAPGTLPPAPGIPPFKGLYFFDVADADLFFGREHLTARIVKRLAGGERFLAIVGASGSGKSSLVRAGVAATLLPEGDRVIHIITPTVDPLEALYQALWDNSEITVSISGAAHLRDAMSANPQALLEFVLRRFNADQQLLIVVDQFEELFTLCQNTVKRQAFLDNLLIATAEPGPLTVVITLRAAFYHHCAEHEMLRLAVESHQVYIGAMTHEELYRAIVTPAQHGNWSFEPGLVDVLLEDVGAAAHRSPEPGALPLLSHALLETWKRRQGRTLTLSGYAEAGGVRGAIALSAEAVYRALPPDQQAIARTIFLRLTEFGAAQMNTDNTLYTRRRASLQEMQPVPTAESAIQTVLDTLARARLITVERDAVEVAHEALIREWPTLRAWLEADLEGLRTHRQLTEAAQAWVGGGRDAGDLYRGARLAQAEEWARAEHRELNALEREFLAVSIAEMERIEAAREAQRRRELAAARKLAELQQRRAEERDRLLRWIGLAAGLLLVVAVIAAVLGRGYRAASLESAALAEANAAVAAQNAAVAASAQAAEAQALRAQDSEAEQRAVAEAMEHEAARQRDVAREQARINLAMSLSGQAALHQEKNSALALLLALEANAMLDSSLTRGALMAALDHSPGKGRYLTGSTSSVESLAIRPDDAILASAGSGEILFWDAVTGEPVAESLTGLEGVVPNLVYTGDGRFLAALVRSSDAVPAVLFWETAGRGGVAHSVGAFTSMHFSGGIESYMAISPDGHYLALAGCLEPYTLPSGLAFCAGGGVTLWDITGILAGTGDSVEVGFLDITGEVYAVSFSPDGAVVALAGCAAYGENACEQGFTLLWESATGEVTGPSQDAFTGSPMRLRNAVTFTPDGAYLATGGCLIYDASGVCTEGQVDFWDLDTYTSAAQYTVEGENGIQSLASSPDGQTLAVGSSDTIRLWEPASQSLRGLPLIGHTGHVLALAFTPDGQTLYSGGQDLKIGQWDLAQRGGIGSRLALNPMPSFQIAYAPDGHTIAESTIGGIDLWDAVSGDLVDFLPLNDPGTMVWDVDFSPDGTLLASAGLSDGAIILWDLDTRLPVGQPVVPVPGASAYSVAFSPDGGLLATSGDAAEIVLWDVQGLVAGAPVSRTLTGHEHGGNPQVVFSPDGKLLASAGHDNTVLLWDVATGEQLGSALVGHEDNVLTVAFSPDGKILASAGQDTTIHLWNVTTRALLAKLDGHNQFVWRLAFTPDGSTLASLDAWGILRLWDMRDPENPGQPIGETLPGHQAWAWGLALSPDGRTAVSSARSGEIQRWQIDLAGWRERACAIADRNLTPEEWALYLPGEPYRETCPVARQ